MEKTIYTQKEFSREFQEELLNLFEMCFENHTDTCTYSIFARIKPQESEK